MDAFYATIIEDLKNIVAADAWQFEERERFAQEQTLIIPKEKIVEVMLCLRDKHHFQFLIDVTAVDWPQRNKRFDVVYHLLAPVEKNVCV